MKTKTIYFLVLISTAVSSESFATSLDKAKVGRCNADIAMTRSALLMFYMDNGYLPQHWDSLIPKYIDAKPRAIAGEPMTFSIISDSEFIITCVPKKNCKVQLDSRKGEFETIGDCLPAPPNYVSQIIIFIIISMMPVASITYFVRKTAKKDISLAKKILAIIGIIIISLIVYMILIIVVFATKLM